ncbi:MAG: hypothetical protein DMF89_03100 [Acidobacteria bacterium]|nr:MAG: hypothetical protein DMF89_03100 [Acidobacteriota bacterium]
MQGTVSAFNLLNANPAEACRAYLAQLRWPAGFRCPKCGAGKAWPVGPRLECAACGRQASVTAGTIFQGTRTPLPTRCSGRIERSPGWNCRAWSALNRPAMMRTRSR